VLRSAHSGDVVVAKTDPPLLSVVLAPIAKLKGAHLVNWLQDVFPEVAERLNTGGSRGRFFAKATTPVRNWSLKSAKMNVVVGDGMAAHLKAQGVPEKLIKVTTGLTVSEDNVRQPRQALPSAWSPKSKIKPKLAAKPRQWAHLST
jgi:hypothetical protein